MPWRRDRGTDRRCADWLRASGCSSFRLFELQSSESLMGPAFGREEQEVQEGLVAQVDRVDKGERLVDRSRIQEVMEKHEQTAPLAALHSTQAGQRHYSSGKVGPLLPSTSAGSGVLSGAIVARDTFSLPLCVHRFGSMGYPSGE